MSSTLLQKHAGKLLGQALTISAESLAGDGVEREYVFFGRMVDKADLEKADSYEDQVQYRILLPAKKGREISVRIRKTISWKDGNSADPVYHLTIKSFVKGEQGNIEAENELDPEAGEKMLEVFKEQGHDGLIKRRYFFKCGLGYFPDYPNPDEKVGVRMRFPEGMVWEVDVPKEFKDDESLDRSELDDGCWVKLDLEVITWDLKIKDGHFDVPFPIRMTDVIYEQPGERSDENEKKVKKALAAMKPKMGE
jgi:hypothetical protein